MGYVKYPVLDDALYLKMMGVCAKYEQPDIIAIFDLTSMHISSLCTLNAKIVIRQGSKTYLRWVQPETNRTLQALVPDDRSENIDRFLKMRWRKSRQHHHSLVKEIGLQAGFEDAA